MFSTGFIIVHTSKKNPIHKLSKTDVSTSCVFNILDSLHKDGLKYQEKNKVIVSNISRLKRDIFLNYLIFEKDVMNRVLHV